MLLCNLPLDRVGGFQQNTPRRHLTAVTLVPLCNLHKTQHPLLPEIILAVIDHVISLTRILFIAFEDGCHRDGKKETDSSRR